MPTENVKKIVVTGALGHIGSFMIRELPRAFPHAEIVMIDNMLTQRSCSLFNLPEGVKYRFVEADVLEMKIEPEVESADVVIHLAAITDAAGSFKNRERVEHVNYNATVRVAEACSRADVPMIHLSSTSVYGTQSDVVAEDCSIEELKPQSPYAETKLREEQFLRDLGSARDHKFIICRFGTIAGVSPGMRFHTAVNKFCWQASMGQPLTVWKTALHQKRPYLLLSDAVEAVKLTIKQRLFDGEVYNVLTDNLTVNDIITYIREFVHHLEIEYVDTEIMNQLSYEVSSLRFKSKGFQFKGNMKDTIRETIALLNNARDNGSR